MRRQFKDFCILVPLLKPALTRIPRGRVPQILGQSEALSVAPTLIGLILHIAMSANDDLLT